MGNTSHRLYEKMDKKISYNIPVASGPQYQQNIYFFFIELGVTLCLPILRIDLKITHQLKNKHTNNTMSYMHHSSQHHIWHMSSFLPYQLFPSFSPGSIAALLKLISETTNK